MEQEGPTLGEQEMDLLRFLSSRGALSGSEVAEQFGEGRGLARTTVLTMLERLRTKGYLTRKRKDGVFQYSPRVPQTEVLNGVVRRFVERTLGGSVSPVVAYLARERHISDEDLDEIEKLVAELKAERGGPAR
jgi:predicted transcriptional regulator